MSKVFVFAAIGCVGCVGEASVSYQGAVVQSTASGYHFDAAPNPASLTPIVGAMVVLTVENRSAPAILTDSDGRFTAIEMVFGGFAGVDTHLSVRATAPDGRSTTYEAIYENTADPTIANPSCDPACPPVFLNLEIAGP